MEIPESIKDCQAIEINLNQNQVCIKNRSA